MKKTLMIILGSALATGVAIKAAPALSQPAAVPAQTNVSIVRTADLDLSTSVGQRRLEQRLAIAAGEVCGKASDSDLKAQNEVRKCRKDVLSAARARSSAMIASAPGEVRIVVAAQQ
jgi:UrcA family protein